MCDIGLIPNDLTNTQLKVFLTCCRFSKGTQVTVNQTDLTIATGLHRATIYRAMESLMEKGLISRNRTKRNFGKFSNNEYLIHHVANHVANHVAPCCTDATSTAGQGSSNCSNDSSTYCKELNTTYSIVLSETKQKEGEKVRYQEDDDVQGFGLLDDDIKPPKEKVSKRTSKTRHLRPEEEWTALDVAAEFKKRVTDRIPGVVNVVNTIQLSKILGKNRKDFNLTATIELEVMDLFFNDWWFKNKAEKEPHYIAGRFLRFFTSHLNRALDNLGLQKVERVDIKEVKERSEFIYASDGTEFDNSIPGRVELKEYEEGLKKDGHTQRQ